MDDVRAERAAAGSPNCGRLAGPPVQPRGGLRTCPSACVHWLITLSPHDAMRWLGTLRPRVLPVRFYPKQQPGNSRICTVRLRLRRSGAPVVPNKFCWGLLQAVLTFLLARAGVFAGDGAHTLFTNQLRTGAAQFDNLQSKKCIFTRIWCSSLPLARFATADPGISFFFFFCGDMSHAEVPRGLRSILGGMAAAASVQYVSKAASSS